jgi:hypothetical protein
MGSEATPEVALDVKVILTPPCKFHESLSVQIYRVASEYFNAHAYPEGIAADAQYPAFLPARLLPSDGANTAVLVALGVKVTLTQPCIYRE